MASTILQKLKVGLVQIGEMNRTYRPQQQHWHVVNGLPMPNPSARYVKSSVDSSVYVPYSIGLLQAYVERHAPNPDRYDFLLPLFKPVAIETAVSHLAEADIVGFSAYIWNINLSLAIAKELKQRYPEKLIVFGGPQVPDHADQFLRDNPFIDLACHGEGEQVFLSILENYPLCSWDFVPSISYLQNDLFIQRLLAPRIRDLSTVPSPYLEGVFDDLMAAHPEHEWLVMFETNRGCPFSCTYCDWGSAVAAKVNRFDMARVKDEIEWFAQNKINYVFSCDANFGIFPRDIEIAQHVVDIYRKYNSFFAISIQNTKNATERSYRVQKIFSQVITAGVTLSVQTLDGQTLKNIKRDNISLDSFRELQNRYRRDGIATYTDIIMGLPGETYNSFANNVAEVMRSGQHNRLACYNCSILPNAEMGDPAYQAKFGMITVPIPMVHEHHALALTAEVEVQETIETVIATASMPKPEWVKAKSYFWAADMLHYDRVMQLAFIMLHELYGVDYREMIEAIIGANKDKFPVCASLKTLFEEQARAIQAGAPDYVPSEKWLQLWWPVDQYALIQVATEEKLDDLYDEAEVALSQLLQRKGIDFDARLLHESLLLNQSLLRLPFKFSNLTLSLSFNIWEYYEGVLAGVPVTLVERPSTYRIDRTSHVWISWEAWCEDVIDRVYDRPKFLYPLQLVIPEVEQLFQRQVPVTALLGGD
ncbi:MAG: B12-binding domain-containing radical SAM protein [Chloroflexi bacterium]|nr:B12-binding domain-containing radical SAM protein [Chloroflexota bacterium]